MPRLGDAVPTIGASAASIKFHETKRSTPLPPRRGAAVAGSSGNVTCPQGNWTATIMTSDASLELSLEQLISALDKKLFGECARIHSTLLPTPRTLVAAFTAEVRLQELNSGNPQILTWYLQVDILEKKAKEVLRQVGSLRNSIRPVNRLPAPVSSPMRIHGQSYP